MSHSLNEMSITLPWETYSNIINAFAEFVLPITGWIKEGDAFYFDDEKTACLSFRNDAMYGIVRVTLIGNTNITVANDISIGQYSSGNTKTVYIHRSTDESVTFLSIGDYQFIIAEDEDNNVIPFYCYTGGSGYSRLKFTSKNLTESKELFIGNAFECETYSLSKMPAASTNSVFKNLYISMSSPANATSRNNLINFDGVVFRIVYPYNTTSGGLAFPVSDE